MDFPQLGESSPMGHQSIFWGAHVIDDAMRTFLPFYLVSLNMSSHHFSSHLAHFPKIVGALRYSSSFSMQNKTVTQNMKMGEKSEHNVIDDAMRVFLPFKSMSSPYTSSYHFSSYLARFTNIVGALRYSSSFSMQKKGPSRRKWK